MKLDLVNGGTALLDEADRQLVEGRTWRRWDTKTQSYAMSGSGQYMHRLITGANKGQVVHHLNNNGLDNRRDNLHVGTQRDNLAAIGKQPTNTSGYKGVRHTGRNLAKPWVARIKVAGETIHLGYFSTPELAAKAYDEAATGFFGKTAYRNFPHES